MDIEPALKYGVDRIRDAFHKFPRMKGWAPEDYRIFMVVDEKWGMYSVQFLSRAYGNYTDSTDFRYYDELLDFLEAEFKDDPDLFDALNISLAGLEGYTYFARYPEYGPSVIPIDDAYLNPEAKGFREDFRREHGIRRP